MGGFLFSFFQLYHGKAKDGYYDHGCYHDPYWFYAHSLSSSLGKINQPAIADNMATIESPVNVSMDALSLRKLPITPTVIEYLDTSMNASPSFLLLSMSKIISKEVSSCLC